MAYGKSLEEGLEHFNYAMNRTRVLESIAQSRRVRAARSMYRGRSMGMGRRMSIYGKPMSRPMSNGIRDVAGSGVLSRPMGRTGPRMMGKGALRGRGASAAALAFGPPPKNPAFFARHGKAVAGAVALGLGLHMSTTRNGRGVDRSQGRPRGVFGY